MSRRRHRCRVAASPLLDPADPWVFCALDDWPDRSPMFGVAEEYGLYELPVEPTDDLPF